MIKLTLTAAMLFLFSGCSAVGLSSDSVGVVTEEYGQCLANTKPSPTFNKKTVTFLCQGERVLLGDAYKYNGKNVIDSGLFVKKGKKYVIRDKQKATVVRGLHTVCQLKPMQGEGDQEIQRFYFDMKLKECRPFKWSGKGGFVPFKNRDECEQFCNYKYRG